MKIDIGPYVYRWTTSNFEHWTLRKLHKKHHWEIEDDELTKLDHFIEKVCDHWQTVLNYTVNQYFDRKKRKVKIKIDYYDTWSMDSTLSPIILPMLKQLRDAKHGSPFVADKDVPKGLGLRSTEAPPKENDWDSDDNLHKRWDWVMDELVWTFEQLADEDNDAQFHSGEIDMQWDPVDAKGNPVPKEEAKLYRMSKGPNDTHVYDKKAHAAHQKRIQRGLELFGKYYQGLWD